MSTIKTDKILAIAVCLLFCRFAMGQSQNVDQLKETFAAYNDQIVQEKIFVHTDKSFYVAGETIWFASYQVEAKSNKPFNLSKVVYVELLNSENKPVLQAKVKTTEGKGDGFLDLSTSLPTGNYLFRAYTSWMQNFDPALYFQKAITIVNTFKKPDWKSLETTAKPSLQIFPEGGHLVYGLQSTVAFKLTDGYSKGLDAKGYVLSSTNDTVATLQSYKFGMGYFQLKPEEGKAYRIELVTDNHEMLSKTIDSIRQKGYVLHVADAEKDQLEVTIQSSVNNSESVYCLVHTKQQVKHAELVKLVDGTARLSLNKSILSDGISRLTIFNSDRQPLCERLIYKTPSKQFVTEIKTDKQEYNTREKIDLSLTRQSQSNDYSNSHISLAVFHLDSLQNADAENISTYFWLTSDLGMAIENPAYYFSHPEDEQAADLLMLTNGWRRFSWDSGANKKPLFALLPDYEGHLIQTRFTDKSTGLPLAGLQTYLSVSGRAFQFSQSVTDANGLCRFVVKETANNNAIIVQAIKDSVSYNVEVLSPFSNKYAPYKLRPFNLPNHFESNLLFANQSMQVQNVFGPSFNIVPQQLDSMHFYGKPYKTYYLDDFTRFPTMEEVLKEYVTEVRVRKQKASFTYNVFNATFKSFFELPPLVLVDGVPFANADKVMSLDPLTVQKIDIVASKFGSGNTINNGLVSYITYEGEMGGLSLDPNAVVVEYEGLQQKREFAAPSYETEALKQTRVPDFRNLLYWAPNISIKNKTEATLSFYTGDVKGKYIIVVQGLSDDGSTSYNYSTISVIK